METDKFENSLLTIRGRRPLSQSYDTADSCNGVTEEKMNSRIDRLWKNYDAQKKEQSNKGPFIVLGLIFVAAVVAMCFVYGSFPKLRAEDRERIKLPKSVEDAKGLGRALSNYTDEYFTQVLLGFIVTYIFLQTFAIPGSIFLSILSGFLFPFPLALFLVCLCSSVGASFCYLLFYLVGRKLVRHYIPDKVDRWCEQVSRHQDNLLSYIIFLRITPFLPNWFINITSPVIDVPLFHFFLGTFIGVAPPSFGFISAGVELYVLTTTGDVMSIKSIMIVVVSALLSLAPVIFKRQLKNKIE